MVDVRPNVEAVRNLRAVGLRPTRQRLALAQLLFGHGNHHVTAESLYVSAQNSDIKVSLAPVYNTLHQFTAAGLLRQVVVDSTRSYFDTNVDEHQHFFFEDTGEIADILETPEILGAPGEPGARINSIGLMDLPSDMEVSRVDIVVRLRSTA